MSLTYSSYLKINELIDLQDLKSDPQQHDEMLFIVIHQTYELWFKQILHEFTLFQAQLDEKKPWKAVRTIRRILMIMRTLVQQTDILETMTPISFNSFRTFLKTASGFQSLQFRELEMLCGIRHPHLESLHNDDPVAMNKIKARDLKPTIWETFINFLSGCGYDVEIPIRINTRGLQYNPSEKNQTALLSIAVADEELSILSDHLIDFDEALQEWRYRHLKMVERTIGYKTGTGGTEGIEYLRRTLHRTIFPDLWMIRSLM